ncbi:exosortase A [Erythrobacter sp. JK5]|uniref:exosortase A n=1 Tax=Erythrobacter sp. JK5 TaxID=2829500 RepID=UPI001BA82675|nr:exosortase A [Erythrobacter sp. JK5]QUL38601.1 exosortase A [Erythrobacter sp. JK5]
MPPDATLPAPGQRSLPDTWRTPLLGLALAVLALGLLAAREWGEMLHQWWNVDTYNHILLVLPILVWLVAMKGDDLAQTRPRPWLPGLGLVAAALGLWWIGRASGLNLLAHAGAVGAIQGAVVALLGKRISLLLALPIGFAAFLVPFGDEIIAPLQTITAEIAIALTHASGVPAVIDGIYIDTPVGLFIVAEACSGVKFLIAMVTLGVLVCFTRFDSWSRRALFMLAAVIVPVLANGVRAWGTIYIAQSQGVEFAAGFDHIVYGWIFFAIVVGLVLAGAWRFFEREPDDYGWSLAELEAMPLASDATGGASIHAALALIVGLTVAVGVAAAIVAPAAIG